MHAHAHTHTHTHTVLGEADASKGINADILTGSPETPRSPGVRKGGEGRDCEGGGEGLRERGGPRSGRRECRRNEGGTEIGGRGMVVNKGGMRRGGRYRR